MEKPIFMDLYLQVLLNTSPRLHNLQIIKSTSSKYLGQHSKKYALLLSESGQCSLSIMVSRCKDVPLPRSLNLHQKGDHSCALARRRIETSVAGAETVLVTSCSENKMQ